MAQYFIDVFDGTVWALDPEGIELASDEDVEKAALAGLRVLIEERLNKSVPVDLVVRVNDEDSESAVRPASRIRPRWVNSPPQVERHQDD